MRISSGASSEGVELTTPQGSLRVEEPPLHVAAFASTGDEAGASSSVPSSMATELPPVGNAAASVKSLPPFESQRRRVPPCVRA